MFRRMTVILIITFIFCFSCNPVLAQTYIPNNIKAFDVNQVKETHWYDDIAKRLEKEYIVQDLSGMDSNLSRGELAKIITNTNLLESSYYTINPFSDLKFRDKYYDDVLNLYWNGIYSGIESDDGTLKADAAGSLTREQAAVFLVRAFGLSGGSKSAVQFNDSNLINLYAANDVNTCGKLGIIKGYPNGNFKPQNYVTKAEFMAMIYNVTCLDDSYIKTDRNIKSTFTDQYVSKNVSYELNKVNNDFYITLTNMSNTDYGYGDEFQLEFKKDGKWIVDTSVKCDSDQILYILNAGKKSETHVYIDLSKLGKCEYRIVKIVNMKGKEMNKEFIPIEFTI